jgi:hypothetical protein
MTGAHQLGVSRLRNSLAAPSGILVLQLVSMGHSEGRPASPSLVPHQKHTPSKSRLRIGYEPFRHLRRP